MGIDTQKIFTGWPVILDAVTLNHIRSVSLASEVNQLIFQAGGSLGVDLSGTASANPTIAIGTGDLGTVLTSLNPTNSAFGLDVSTLAKAQYRLRGGDSTASVNVTATSVAGFAHVTDFGAEQGATNGASANLIYYGLRSGANDPLTVNTGVALTGTPSVAAPFVFGPCQFEGTQLTTCTSTRVTTGLSYVAAPYDGDTTPTTGTVNGHAFTFEVVCKQMELAAVGSAPIGKTTPLSTGIKFYYTAVDPSTGDRYSNATAAHVLCQATSGSYVLEGMGADGTDDATVRLRVTVHGLPTISVSQTISV